MKALLHVLLFVTIALVSACSGGSKSSTTAAGNGSEAPLGAANPGTEPPATEVPTSSIGNESTDSPDVETTAEGEPATGEPGPAAPPPETPPTEVVSPPDIESPAIVNPEIVDPVSSTPSPNPTAVGNYSQVKAGGFFAANVESLYIANQQDQSIDHINPVTGEVLHAVSLLHIPTLVEYAASLNSLYVGMSGVGELIRIDLETYQQSTITVPGEVQSLAVHNNRLFFTVGQSSNKWDLYSLGADNLQSSHGVIGGNLLMGNPATDEITAAMSVTSPASVFRYTIGADDMVSEIQVSRDLGSNVRDLAITKDGLRLAVVAGSGNNGGFTVHDIQASDLTVSSGSWDVGAFPISADFSDSGELLAASNDTDLMIFNAKTYTLTEKHDVDESLCGLNYYHLTQVLFSEDDHHVFAKLVCGFDRDKSVFFFFPVP